MGNNGETIVGQPKFCQLQHTSVFVTHQTTFRSYPRDVKTRDQSRACWMPGGRSRSAHRRPQDIPVDPRQPPGALSRSRSGYVSAMSTPGSTGKGKAYDIWLMRPARGMGICSGISPQDGRNFFTHSVRISQTRFLAVLSCLHVIQQVPKHSWCVLLLFMPQLGPNHPCMELKKL